MKTKSMLAALALLMTSGAAQATCLEMWPPDMKTRPDITCVSLTDRLLVSLEGATKAEVIKAMKANGRPLSPGKDYLANHPAYNRLHFLSAADIYSGIVNFSFEGDKVVHIYGTVDFDITSSMEFSWGNTSPDVPFACSDLPGSRYARCNK
jgi:hypothetical protein